jgi:drug/metabolite transporter (DMT)-like permease
MALKMELAKLIPFAIFYACCSVIGLLLIKTGGSDGVLLAGIRLNWKIFLGLAIYFAGFCTYLFLVQRYDLSYVFPLVIGMNYVAVVLAAAFVLREQVAPTQWLGIVAVFAGILLMNLKPGGK